MPFGRFPNSGRYASTLYNSGAAGPALRALSNDWFFGPTVVLLAALFQGDSVGIATAVSAHWTYDQTGWTLNSATREAVVMHLPPSGNLAAKLVLENSAHGVGVLIPTSQDGRNGYLLRVLEDGGARYARLSRVVEAQIVEDTGAAKPWITLGANDFPTPAGEANIDISASLATATRYTLLARRAAGVLELSINDTLILRHVTTGATYPDPPRTSDSATFAPSWYTTFPSLTAVAFFADVSGARVVSADVHPLNDVTTGEAEVLVAAAGGNLYAGSTADGPRLAATGVFPADVPVDGAEYNGLMLMVGGGRAREYSPVSNLVSLWTPTEGLLPGQTDPGTTTANIVERIGVRIMLADIKGDEQNAMALAVGNHRDANTAKDAPGAAFVFSGYQAMKLGQPIKALCAMTNGSIFIACTNSSYVLIGDPIRGYTEAQEKSRDCGGSGNRAVWLDKSGRVIMHTPQGAVTVSLAGILENFSGDVLNDGIQFTDLPTDLAAIVIRDPKRGGTHFMLTREAGPSLHFWYDEKEGAFKRGTGGFHPETIPEAMAPLCACQYKGEVLFGCRDGYIRSFSDAAFTDDGTLIDSFTTLTQLAVGSEQMESQITRIEALLGLGSGPARLQIIKGRTSEEAWTAGTVVLDTILTPPKPKPLIQQVRGAALLIRLAGSNGSRVRLERMDAVYFTGTIKSRP